MANGFSALLIRSVGITHTQCVCSQRYLHDWVLFNGRKHYIHFIQIPLADILVAAVLDKSQHLPVVEP